MKKITPEDPLSASADITAENIDKLRELFPELLTESGDGVAVNVDVLKSLVGDQTVTDADEKYGLSWHGKRMARQLALTPSTGTLRPCPEESVDWDSTQNVFIEGDNLEVLKLLQKSYANKVKMIYIDPPYNTGKDFVYKDNFKDNIANYKKLTGQTDEDGKKVTTNSETSGRFHTDWLNMIYPRLKLARNLLRKDGVIFISIDYNELSNLKRIGDEIFGEECYLGELIWKRRVSSALANNNLSTDHEYVVCYMNRDFKDFKGNPKNFSNYKNPDKDVRGDWIADNLTVGMDESMRPNQAYTLTDPETGNTFKHNPNRVWAYIPESMEKLIQEKRIIFPKDSSKRPMLKRFKKDLRDSHNPFSSLMLDYVGMNTEATRTIQGILGGNIFDYSKPLSLISTLVNQTTDKDDIILDFFCGSASSAHAVLNLNMKDGWIRKYIMVQLPEVCDEKSAAAKAGYKTIADIGKERIRRAGKKIKEDNADKKGIEDLDIGFRVFKLDSSNINEWRPKRDDIAESLEDHAEHIKDDRSEDDLLYELLLKLGLDLCIPIEQKEFAGLTVHNIGAGTLFVCLATEVKAEAVEVLAEGIASWAKELEAQEPQCVFRDSGFSDNKSKSNLTAILNQRGIKNIRSI